MEVPLLQYEMATSCPLCMTVSLVIHNNHVCMHDDSRSLALGFNLYELAS